MILGVCTFDLHISESGSLKSKRQVLKSVKDRIRAQFNVSVAEVENQDLWQRATVGVACIAVDSARANQVLDHVVNLVETIPSVEIIDYQIEII